MNPLRASLMATGTRGGESGTWQMKSYTYQDEHASIHVVNEHSIHVANIHNTYKHN